jgi:hypothetical protein
MYVPASCERMWPLSSHTLISNLNNGRITVFQVFTTPFRHMAKIFTRRQIIALQHAATITCATDKPVHLVSCMIKTRLRLAVAATEVRSTVFEQIIMISIRERSLPGVQTRSRHSNIGIRVSVLFARPNVSKMPFNFYTNFKQNKANRGLQVRNQM